MQNPASSVQMATGLYEVNINHAPFQIYTGMFQDYPQLEQGSPQVALAVAREVQNHCASVNGAIPNPVRINAFNIISEGGYQNSVFPALVQYTLVRIYIGCKNSEFPDWFSAGNVVVPNMVRFFSAWLAGRQNPAVLQGLDHAIITNVNKDAALWERQMQIIAGQLAFEPFSSQMLADTLGTFDPNMYGQTGQPGQSGSMDFQNSGAFVPGAHSQAQYRSQWQQNGNNAQPEGNRFTRELERRKSMLQGSMQGAMERAGMGGDAFSDARWDQALSAQRARNERAGKTSEGATPAAQAPNEIAKMAAAALAQIKEQAPQPKEFVFNQVMDDGVEYGIVRLVRETDAAAFNVSWRASSVQRHFPAYDPERQNLVYLELETGQWAAAIQEKQEMTTETLFDYEAHAINPLLGFPEPEEVVQPAAPDAKVEFGSKGPTKKNMNIAVTGKVLYELSEEAVTMAASKKVRGLEHNPDGYLAQGAVIDLVPFTDAEKAMADLETINGLVVANSLASASSMLRCIENEKMRETVNKMLVESVNNWLALQAGMPNIFIDDFIEDAPELEDHLRNHPSVANPLIADKLKQASQLIVAGSFKATVATPFKDALESLYDVEYSAERLERSIVVMRNAAAMWVDRTESGLSVRVPDDMPALIAKKHLPYLHAIAQCAFEATGNNTASHVPYVTLVTTDGAQYVLSESCMSTPENRAFFISKKK